MVNGCAEGVSNCTKEFKSVPGGDALLGYIKSQEREDIKRVFDELVERNIKLLRKKGCFKKSIPIAVDWCDVRYYGSRKTEMVVGTKHDKGTSYSYQYITVSVLSGGERLTIIVIPIPFRKGIKRLLELVFDRLKKLKIKVRYALLDAGFDADEVIDYLQSVGVKYCMRKRSSKSLRKLKHGTIVRRETKRGTRYKLIIAYHKRKKKKYFFVTNMNQTADDIVLSFDFRWGIETSYRMHNKFLIKTTSKNYTVRLFYYLFACAMYNCWVTYQWILGRHITVTEVKIAFIIISVLGEDALIKNHIHT